MRTSYVHDGHVPNYFSDHKHFRPLQLKLQRCINMMCGVIEQIIAEAEKARSPLMARTKQVHRRSGRGGPWKCKEIAQRRAAQEGLDPQLKLELDSSFS